MPIRMKQWSVDKLPVARAVYDNHETNRQAPEDIESKVARL